MRILYVAARYDYGDPTRGLSFEHYNFYDSLVNMGHDVVYFDCMSELTKLGKRTMNRKLLDIAKAEHPDLVFFCLLKDEFDPEIIRDIARRTDAVTFNWFCDDHWRFEPFTQHFASAFSWVSTTAASALPKYQRIGYRNVILTQWACNHNIYRPLDLPLKYDVTFVGQVYGDRRSVIMHLRDAGIKVNVWGHGWESGRLSQDQMIEVFNQSRINLNLSNSSPGSLLWAFRHGKFLPRQRQHASQIKGRNFEVPGCGGFLLTDVADGLADYFVLNSEVATFRDRPGMTGTIKHYLEHEEDRMRIAAAGYQRVVGEHTYERRFNTIFEAMDLPAERVASFPERSGMAALRKEESP